MFMFSFNLFFYHKYFPFKPDFVIVSSPSPLPIINGIYLKFRFKSKFLYEKPTILIFSPDVVFQTRLAVVEIPQSGVGIINSV